VVGVASLLVVATACQGWAQYMGNPALNGSTGASESAIGIGNVATLTEAFTVPLGFAYPTTGVTVSGSRLFAASMSTLIAADATGANNCGGTPKVCQPLWTAALPDVAGGTSQPLVRGNVVYESSEGVGSGQLAAYDAQGVANCSGSPTVCQPLWTADVKSPLGPNVDGGTLFISNDATAQLEAFAANGVTNCSGSPKVCLPLWTANIASNSVPAIAGGKVYVASRGANPVMAVYDEAGTVGCSGSPRVCQPLFTAPLPGPTNGGGSVDVSGGVAYVGSGGQLLAIDADGTTNCSGSPAVCVPLWSASVGDMPAAAPAVAGGRVYVDTGVYWAFDASGLTNCSGSPKVCTALFSGPFATNSWISPLVTNGLVFIGGQAWDAAGIVGCAPPNPCSPVWHTAFNAGASATVVSGTLFVRDQNGTIHALRPH